MTLKVVLRIPRNRKRSSPNMVRPQGRVQPFRDRDEIESTPWSAVAVTFAEAVNMSTYARLETILEPDVTYSSEWSGRKLHGRKNVLEWFRLRLCQSIAKGMAGEYLNAQVVVLPDGRAGVLTAIVSVHEMSLTTFEGDGTTASNVHVTTRFNRSELRETLYCPPEG